MVLPQSKFHHNQQNQDDAVDVHNSRNLFGVIECPDFDLTSVECHKHSHQLEQTFVGIRNRQPDGGIIIANENEVPLDDLLFLWTVMGEKEKTETFTKYF